MAEAAHPDHFFDVAIIGGGPAGLTAGIYAARANLRTILVQGASTVSQITITDMIENYPGFPEGINGFDLVERLKKQASQFGLEILSEDTTSLEAGRRGDLPVWRIGAGGKTIEALSVVLATGASWRRLGVPGEEQYIGRGVSFCATCDGPFYRNREVVVVGGGNTAVQEALFLTHFAGKVTVVHRRDRLRATGILQDRAFANGKIAFAWNSVVQEILGKETVEAVRLRDVKTGEEREIPAEGVFLFVGLIPNTDLVRDLADREPDGAVRVDRAMRTSAPGLFACGDCTATPLRQVITACGDGAVAAFSAQLYVEDIKGMAY